jgi:5-(carboxyamino)imidazole ribonucleotide mutase
MKSLVTIIMGSISDLPVMEKSKDMLAEFGIPFEIKVLSAHRSPHETAKYATSLVKKGIKVVIAGAGGAAHLPGVIASFTTLPVIGVPIYSAPFKGLDAMLAILQMPAGIPVATVAVGESGAKNAGILAAEILATNNKTIQSKLVKYKKDLAKKVAEAQKKLEEKKW